MKDTLGQGDVSPSLDTIIEKLNLAKRLLIEESSSIRLVTRVANVEPFSPIGNVSPTVTTCEKWHDSWRTHEELCLPSIEVGLDTRIVVLRNGKQVEWSSTPKVAIVWRGASNTSIAIAWDYFALMGIDVYQYLAASMGVTREQFRVIADIQWNVDRPFYPETLEAYRSEYRVLPEPVFVDGYKCWTIERRGVDKFAIDIENGYVIRERVFNHGIDKPPMFRVLHSDFRAVKDGLYLPFTQIVEQFGKFPEGDKEYWGKLINRVTNKIETIEFDKLSERTFELDLPLGSRVIDMIDEKEYIIRKPGSDPFDESFAKVNTIAMNAVKRSGWSRTLLSGIITIVCLTIIALVFRLKERGGKS